MPAHTVEKFSVLHLSRGKVFITYHPTYLALVSLTDALLILPKPSEMLLLLLSHFSRVRLCTTP